MYKKTLKQGADKNKTKRLVVIIIIIITRDCTYNMNVSICALNSDLQRHKPLKKKCSQF